MGLKSICKESSLRKIIFMNFALLYGSTNLQKSTNYIGIEEIILFYIKSQIQKKIFIES